MSKFLAVEGSTLKAGEGDILAVIPAGVILPPPLDILPVTVVAPAASLGSRIYLGILFTITTASGFVGVGNITGSAVAVKSNGTPVVLKGDSVTVTVTNPAGGATEEATISVDDPGQNVLLGE